MDAERADALRVLLPRLYARLRARGTGQAAACEQAAQLAADLLAVGVDDARTVMAQIPLRGLGRPL